FGGPCGLLAVGAYRGRIHAQYRGELHRCCTMRPPNRQSAYSSGVSLRNLSLTVVISREGDRYVAQCLKISVSSFGDTQDEAPSSPKPPIQPVEPSPSCAPDQSCARSDVEMPDGRPSRGGLVRRRLALLSGGLALQRGQ